MTENAHVERLPRPFYSDGWTRAKRPHARALWDFHTALINARAPKLDGSDLTAFFDSERDRFLEDRPLTMVSESVSTRAAEAVKANDIPNELLGRQIRAARMFQETIRFADSRAVASFIADWAHAHGRALAHLAGASGSWQLPYIDEFSTAFFWVGRLVTLRSDLAKDWLFIPESDLEQAGITVEQLRNGERTEPVRRVLWKQTIRAKDAFAQSEQLVLDLPRRHSSAAKRWWIGGLEVLNEIARRDYDVFSEPVALSTFYRLQVRFQARFGRTTFRSR